MASPNFPGCPENRLNRGTLWGVRGAAQGVTNLDLEQQIISQAQQE